MLANLLKLSSFFLIIVLTWIILPNNQIQSPTEIKSPAPLERIIQISEETEKEESIEIIETPKKEILNIEPEISKPTESVVVQQSNPPINFADINNTSRKSIVNILCRTNGNDLSTITGTGVIIDPRGIILTNAHIAQYLLLKNYRFPNFVECFVRTGEPAVAKYNTELVYISTDWVKENKTILKEENPKGTGENDFAFLRITGSLDNSPLPEYFDYLKMDIRETLDIGEPVLLISYPAGFLGNISIIQNLYITSAETYIQKLFTFKENTLDLISVGGTVLSQKGSSGGAVVDSDGNLIGLISTSSDGDTTSERDLRAITIAHINRSLKDPFGGISSFMSMNMQDASAVFNATLFPALSELIISELEN